MKTKLVGDWETVVLYCTQQDLLPLPIPIISVLASLPDSASIRLRLAALLKGGAGVNSRMPPAAS